MRELKALRFGAVPEWAVLHNCRWCVYLGLGVVTLPGGEEVNLVDGEREWDQSLRGAGSVRRLNQDGSPR
jgi:hypothetical protein